MRNLRISVSLGRDELEALVIMAEEACRDPREQVRFLLREEARRRGLLAVDASVASGTLGGSESVLEGVSDEHTNT